MAETEMVEKVAKACREAVALDRGRSVPFEEMSYIVARAAIDAMKDPPFDMLGAMYEAMIDDKWDGSQAPMVGAGWDAAIDAALSPPSKD